jgi:hypothetical protein
VLTGLGQHVANYGLVIPRLGNFVIAINETDAANLKKLYTDAAYLRTVGGVDSYQKFAAGKAMLGAGEGMAQGGGTGGGDGGGLLGGAGLGVGLGLAQQLIAAQQRPATADPGAPRTICNACGSSVSPGKFCGSCGRPLGAAPTCAACHAPLAPGAQFCGQCGQRRTQT